MCALQRCSRPLLSKMFRITQVLFVVLCLTMSRLSKWMAFDNTIVSLPYNSVASLPMCVCMSYKTAQYFYFSHQAILICLARQSCNPPKLPSIFVLLFLFFFYFQLVWVLCKLLRRNSKKKTSLTEVRRQWNWYHQTPKLWNHLNIVWSAINYICLKTPGFL